jgi:formylglycine-generating enzyme required for sulfatase activity/uncharacterized caspase-like protein
MVMNHLRFPAWFLVLACLGLAGASPAAAQRSITVTPVRPTASAYAESWAVVIGVDDYAHPRVPKLRYAVKDARAVEETLLAQGFRRDHVIRLLDGDATKARIEEALGDRLRQQAGKDDRVLVFFAGHGMTVKTRSGEEEGYLIPVDGDPSRLFSTAISMSALRQISDLLPAKHVLYVVDACYSGYAVYNRAIAEDLLDEMVKKPAIQILTAGRQGDLAQEKGGHGVFTDVLLRGLRGEAFAGRGWLALDELGAWVRERVYAESNKRQVPQFGNLSGDGQFVFFKPGAQTAAAAPAPAQPPRFKEEIVKELGSLIVTAKVPGVEVFLGDRRIGEVGPGRRLTSGELEAGVYRLRARKAGHKDWEREVPLVANQRAEVVIDIEPLGPAKTVKGDDGAEMVLVPAGEFRMGSTREEVDRTIAECRKHSSNPTEAQCKDWYERELPEHRVLLDAFYIDRHETTNALFEAFVRATGHQTTAERQGDGRAWQQKDGKWQWLTVSGASWRTPNGPGTSAPSDHPVVQVSWHDAEGYCKWAGKRLPTEAEWEKAARGADARRYPWGEEWAAVRADGNMAVKATRPVGSYPGGVSPYEVHDMAGNAAEWVADWFDASYYQRSAERNPKGADTGTTRVLRGGSWFGGPIFLRSAYRVNYSPVSRNDGVGFRCARGAS